MSRKAVVVALGAVGLALSPAASRADADLYLSVGQSARLDKDSPLEGPLIGEVIPSLGGSLLKLDLGLYFPFQKDPLVIARPGLRLTLGPFFVRGAVSMRLSPEISTADPALLAGAGLKLPVGDSLGIFAEADALPSRGVRLDESPLEAHVGLVVSF